MVRHRSKDSVSRLLNKMIAVVLFLILFEADVTNTVTSQTPSSGNGTYDVTFSKSFNASNSSTPSSTSAPVFRNSSIYEQTDDKSGNVTPSNASSSSVAPNTSAQTSMQDTKIYQLPRVVRDLGWVIALIVLSSAGIMGIMMIEVWLLIRTLAARNQPSSSSFQSMWLGQVLLFGIFCSYLTLFAFLPFSSPVTCGIIRFCVGICYALCFSVLVVKLLLILDSKSRLHDVSPAFQATLLFFVWSVQLVIDVQWLISSPPKTNLQGPSRLDSEPWGACEPGFASHVQSLVYVMFLVVLCAFLAVCAHGIRTNHSERIFIGLAAGVTIGIWIIWILLGFLMNDHSWHEPCIAFGLFTTVTWILVIMFVPKLYYLHKMDSADPLPELYASGSAGLYPRRVFDPYHGATQPSRQQGHHMSPQRAEESMSRSMRFGDEAATAERNRQNGSNISTSGSRPNEYIYDPHALYLRHPGDPVKYGVKLPGLHSPIVTSPDELFQDPNPAMIFAANPQPLRFSSISSDQHHKPRTRPNNSRMMIS